MAKIESGAGTKSWGGFEIVEREDSQSGGRAGGHSSAGLRHRHSDSLGKEGYGRHFISRAPATRSRRRDDDLVRVTGWKKGQRVGSWARRPGRHLPRVPPRRIRQCRKTRKFADPLRWRLSGIMIAPGGDACRQAGRAATPWKPRRLLCAGHHLQRAAPQRRLAFRPRCVQGIGGPRHLGIQFAKKLDKESPPSARFPKLLSPRKLRRSSLT